jgi:hypothetical protein
MFGVDRLEVRLHGHRVPPPDSYLANFIDPEDGHRWLNHCFSPNRGALAARCTDVAILPEQLALNLTGAPPPSD